MAQHHYGCGDRFPPPGWWLRHARRNRLPPRRRAVWRDTARRSKRRAPVNRPKPLYVEGTIEMLEWRTYNESRGLGSSPLRRLESYLGTASNAQLGAAWRP